MRTLRTALVDQKQLDSDASETTSSCSHLHQSQVHVMPSAASHCHTDVKRHDGSAPHPSRTLVSVLHR